MLSTLLASGLAGAGVLLAGRRTARVATVRPVASGAATTPGEETVRRPPWFPVLVVAGAWSASALGLRSVLQLALVAAVVTGVAALVRRGRARAVRDATGHQVLEACSVLAEELRAGRSPEVALELAGRVCPALEPAVRASRLGADVPAALRRGGGPDLRLVAAGWQVSSRSGEGLGDALDRLAGTLRAARATRRVVASELASARATARLLVALPVLALLAGSGAGTDPWSFLVLTTPGTICLTAGVLLVLAGLWWIEVIADAVERDA